MGKQTLHFGLSIYLGINYTRCCSVVLMHYNNRINNITNLQPNKNQAMTDFEIKRSLIEDDFTTNCLVTFLKLICNRIEVDTVSEMARKEGKSPQGIRVSKRYTKIKIGKQTMVIKNESENN